MRFRPQQPLQGCASAAGAHIILPGQETDKVQDTDAQREEDTLRTYPGGQGLSLKCYTKRQDGSLILRKTVTTGIIEIHLILLHLYGYPLSKFHTDV